MLKVKLHDNLELHYNGLQTELVFPNSEASIEFIDNDQNVFVKIISDDLIFTTKNLSDVLKDNHIDNIDDIINKIIIIDRTHILYQLEELKNKNIDIKNNDNINHFINKNLNVEYYGTKLPHIYLKTISQADHFIYDYEIISDNVLPVFMNNELYIITDKHLKGIYYDLPYVLWNSII